MSRLPQDADEAGLVRHRRALMEIEALRDIAGRRSQTYWLLSRLFLEQPTQPLLADLTRAFLEASKLAEAPLSVEFSVLCRAIHVTLAAPDGLTALQVEFTRLLRGLEEGRGAPPPYESVIRESKLLGDSTMAVEAAYREAGYDTIAADAGPPDHLGAELRFLSLLCYHETEARAANDGEGARTWLQRQQNFLDDHLLRWVPDYCAQIAGGAREDFYSAVATLTAKACAVDREDIDALVEATG